MSTTTRKKNDVAQTLWPLFFLACPHKFLVGLEFWGFWHVQHCRRARRTNSTCGLDTRGPLRSSVFHLEGSQEVSRHDREYRAGGVHQQALQRNSRRSNHRVQHVKNNTPVYSYLVSLATRIPVCTKVPTTTQQTTLTLTTTSSTHSTHNTQQQYPYRDIYVLRPWDFRWS